MMKTCLERLALSGLLAVTMVCGLVNASVETNAESSTSTEPGIVTWEVSKSKKATELDSDNNTTVTLSLPAAETKSKVDVVFVMDHSGYADTADIETATNNMLTTLKAQTNINVSVGVIKFDGWGVDAIKKVSNGAQSDMIALNDANYDVIEGAISGDIATGIGGSNTEQPVRMANEMLAADTDTNAVKYLLVLSDFQTYVYEGSATAGGVTYDNIPVGSTYSYHPDMSGLEDYTNYADYNSWASLKNIYYANNKSVPESDWSWDNQFFRWGYSSLNYPYSQSNWIAYADAGYGEFDTTPANKWALQDLATYKANDAATTKKINDGIAAGTTHHITGNERSMLLTYDAMEQSLAAGTHVIAYRNNGATTTNWDTILKNFPHDMLSDLSSKGATVFQDGASAINVFDNLTNSIIYLMGSGTVEDKIGENFDLVDTTNPISITLSGTTLKCTSTGTNEWSYGDPDANGVYPYVATYTPGADEAITWKINVPVEKAKQVKLSYKLHITTAVPGTYDTNKSAVLTYKDSAGNSYTPETFEVPQVTLKATTKTRDMAIPFDLLEDNGDGTTFINGPRNAASGSTVNYKATINMDQITDIVDTYTGSMGYISGDFTMTLQGVNGLQFKDGSFASSDIKSYFAGDAVDLFELVSAPTYDAATNTITFHAKTVDSLESDGILGATLDEKLKAGIYGFTSGNTSVNVTDGIDSKGYARMVGTFAGTLNYHNQSGSESYQINMTGTQDEPATKADTTLGSYGDESKDTVSATLLKQTSPTPTPTPSAQTTFTYIKRYVACNGSILGEDKAQGTGTINPDAVEYAGKSFKLASYEFNNDTLTGLAIYQETGCEVTDQGFAVPDTGVKK